MLFYAMVGASGLIETGSTIGMFLSRWPDKLFFVSLQGMELGAVGLMLSLLIFRRCGADAAFDLGVEVGERRARRNARPNLVRLPDHAPAHLR